MELLRFVVRNQSLSGGRAKLVSDSIDYVEAFFDFRTEDWSGLSKWAHFTKGETTYDVNLADDRITRDMHLNLEAGVWEVKLHGNDPEGTMRITTGTAHVTVEAYGSLEEGAPLPEVPLSAAEQIDAKAQEALEKAESALEKAQELEEAAANGEFDGADGADGKDGYSPVVEVFQYTNSLTGVSGMGIRLYNEDGTVSEASVEDGKDGKNGSTGENGYTPQRGIDYWTEEDKEEIIREASEGIESGADGKDGEDGFSPVVEVSEIENGHSVSITDAKGEKTFEIHDGRDGADGYTPVKGIDYFDGADGAPGEKGDTGAQGPQGEKGETGATGERGTGILVVTTAPTAYTTATGGFTPAYRIALSTVLTQAKVDEVLVGDMVKYSYYTYQAGYVDASYVYLGTRVSIRGATGSAGTTPVKGTDYWTAEDKAEMVSEVTAALSSEVWTFELEDGTTVTKAVLLG